jgi:predicted RNase H-like nuclease (RuvC/YqgF family)
LVELKRERAVLQREIDECRLEVARLSKKLRQVENAIRAEEKRSR